MKKRIALIVGILIASLLGNSAVMADDAAWQKPVLNTFSFSPNEIELSSGKTDVEITLTVTHPLGISNQSVVIHLENSVYGGNFAYSTTIARADSPANSKLNVVTFKGILKLDPSMPAGVWELSSETLTPNTDPTLANFTPKSASFSPPAFRNFSGAESSVLVRRSGNLNFDFQTFVGPTHPAIARFEDSKPVTIGAKYPIWRVKETYDPKDFFQLRTDRVALQVSTLSPSICAVDGSVLKLLATGTCQYKVFTPKTNDFLTKEISLNAEILPERMKIEINPPVIPTQVVTSFPKVVARSVVTAYGSIVNPVPDTPTVCVASGVELTLYSAGTCTLSYSTTSTESLYASDVVKQTFKVLKEGEPEVVPTPVVTPTPVATPTAKPVVKKTITCVKGKKTVKKTAISPKCPAGYKLKK
jgi:hypothetical protein